MPSPEAAAVAASTGNPDQHELVLEQDWEIQYHGRMTQLDVEHITLRTNGNLKKTNPHQWAQDRGYASAVADFDKMFEQRAAYYSSRSESAYEEQNHAAGRDLPNLPRLFSTRSRLHRNGNSRTYQDLLGKYESMEAWENEAIRDMVSDIFSSAAEQEQKHGRALPLDKITVRSTWPRGASPTTSVHYRDSSHPDPEDLEVELDLTFFEGNSDVMKLWTKVPSDPVSGIARYRSCRVDIPDEWEVLMPNVLEQFKVEDRMRKLLSNHILSNPEDVNDPAYWSDLCDSKLRQAMTGHGLTPGRFQSFMLQRSGGGSLTGVKSYSTEILPPGWTWAERLTGALTDHICPRDVGQVQTEDTDNNEEDAAQKLQ